MESEMDFSLSFTEFELELKTAEENLILFDEIVSWSQIRMGCSFIAEKKKTNKQSVHVWSFIEIFTTFFFIEAKFIQIQRKYITQWRSQI